MAPDPASVVAGQALSSPRKWLHLGLVNDCVWGECQGSGKTPYQTCVQLPALEYKCTCPSRKFPCKHVLGLLLLSSSDVVSFTNKITPPWAVKWLADKVVRAQEADNSSRYQPNHDPKTESVRLTLREKRVADGLEDLAIWLTDLARQGIANVLPLGPAYWDNMAARMVDAQASGVARMLREAGSLPHSGDGWQQRLVLRIGQMHLLVQAYRRRTELTESTMADLRTAIGWTIDKTQLILSEPCVPGVWAVIGQRVVEEDRLRAQRTWLYNGLSKQSALQLQFAHGQLPFESQFQVGIAIAADIVYFPGSVPMRCIIVDQQEQSLQINSLLCVRSIANSFAEFSTIYSVNPWIERLPAALEAITLKQTNGKWILSDLENSSIDLDRNFHGIWRLLALTGGKPADLFGEWDGDSLWPLSVAVDGKVIPL